MSKAIEEALEKLLAEDRTDSVYSLDATRKQANMARAALEAATNVAIADALQGVREGQVGRVLPTKEGRPMTAPEIDLAAIEDVHTADSSAVHRTFTSALREAHAHRGALLAEVKRLRAENASMRKGAGELRDIHDAISKLSAEGNPDDDDD